SNRLFLPAMWDLGYLSALTGLLRFGRGSLLLLRCRPELFRSSPESQSLTETTIILVSTQPTSGTRSNLLLIGLAILTSPGPKAFTSPGSAIPTRVRPSPFPQTVTL